MVFGCHAQVRSISVGSVVMFNNTSLIHHQTRKSVRLSIISPR